MIRANCYRLLVRLAAAAAVCAGGTVCGSVVLNEILAKNRLTNVDEEDDSEDWVEIFNTGGSSVNLAGLTLTNDPSCPAKWALPGVTLDPGNRLIVWLSGKDRYTPPEEAIEGSEGKFSFTPGFIRIGDFWKYIIAGHGSGPPDGWTELSFDDSSWHSGRSGFGYGDGDDRTGVPEGTNAIFTRKVFTVEEPSSLANLVLQVDYDDGFVAYLNSGRVASRVAPSADPGFSSWSAGSHEAGAAARFDLTGFLHLVNKGENVLCVVGLNRAPESSDMTLKAELGTVPSFLHASFRLHGGGEYLALFDTNERALCEVQIPPQTEDHSWGRSPDGTGKWHYLLCPTPGEPNETRAFSIPVEDNLRIYPQAGRYENPVIVRMAVGMEDRAEIHYTTDGSEPTADSPCYREELSVDRNTAFRIAGFIDERRFTEIVSKSYFIESKLELPVMSITMNPEDFAVIHNTANGRGRAWERKAFLEIFDREGNPMAATGMGLRLHGGAGRRGNLNTKKAYRCYFRGCYGDKKLNAPVIPETPVEEFDKLVLRSCFNDSFRTNGRAAYIRDELIRDLHQEMGGLVSHGAWYNVFVNMQYRGIYNVVERMDYEFLSSYFPEEDWDVVKTGNDPLDGTLEEWHRARNFIVQNDMAGKADFERAGELINIPNFTSYMLLNIWAQNHDWPHNNWYAARPREPGAEWIFLSWDAEFGVGLIPSGFTADTFSFVFKKGGYLREMLEHLLANAEYRKYFVHQADRYTHTVLEPMNVISRINDLAETIAADIPEETTVSGGNGSYSRWLSNVNAMRSFARERNSYFLNYIENSSLFDFPAVTTPWVDHVEPDEMVLEGERSLRVYGERFKHGTVFRIGDCRAPIEQYVNSHEVEVLVPFAAGVLGRPVVSCLDPSSGYGSEASDLLEVMAPVPNVVMVSPLEGSCLGGDTVRISGSCLLEGFEVQFGSEPAAGIERPFGDAGIVDVTTPPGKGKVRLRFFNTRPVRLEGHSDWLFTYLEREFVRGDADNSGTVDIGDAVRILAYLFAGGEGGCLDSFDVNDSGEVDLADAIYLLSFLFEGSSPPPVPFPDPGRDPTGDEFSCW